MNEDYKIGDKVWFIKSLQELDWREGMLKPQKTKHPFEKKITQIVHVEDGILYQVKGCHFHSSWIGKIVFSTKEQAEIALKTQFNGGNEYGS